MARDKRTTFAVACLMVLVIVGLSGRAAATRPATRGDADKTGDIDWKGQIRLLRSPDAKVRRRAERRIADELVPLLIKWLTGEHVMTRGKAADLLGRIGLLAKPATAALIRTLKDKDARVAGYAAVALGRIGPTAKAAIPALVEATQQGSKIRPTAAAALVLVDTAGGAAKGIPVLVAMLTDEQEHSRSDAAYWLGRIGPPAKPAVSALTKALKDDSTRVREVAAVALVRIEPATGVKRSMPVLIELLKNKDEWVRCHATWAIARIGPHARATVPALTEALKDDFQLVRSGSVEALGAIGPAAKAAVPALKTAAAKDKHHSVRKAAAEALKRIILPASEVVWQKPEIPEDKICTLKVRIRDRILNADVLAAAGGSFPAKAKSVRLFLLDSTRPVWKHGDIVSVRVYLDEADRKPEWVLIGPRRGFLRIVQPAVKWGKAVGGLVCGISAFKPKVQVGVPYQFEVSIKNISKGGILLLKRRLFGKEPLYDRVYFMQAGKTHRESFTHDKKKFAVAPARKEDFVLLRPGNIYKFTHGTLVCTGPMAKNLKNVKGGLGLVGLTREGTYQMQVRYQPWFTLAKGVDLGGLKPWKGVLVSAPVEVVVPKDPAKPAVKWGKAVGGLVCGISAFKPKVQLGVPYQFEVSVKNISKGGIVLFKRRLGDGYYRVILARAGKQYREYYTIDSKAMARPAASARDLVRLKPKEIYKFTHKTVIASEYKHRRPSLGFIGGVAEGTYQMRVRYEPWERRIAKGVDLGGLKPWKGVLLSAPVEVVVGKDPAKPAHPAAKGRKLFDKADARNFALTLSHSSMRGVNVVGLSTAKPRSQSWHAHTYPQISKAEAAKIIDYMNKSTWPVWPDARGVKFADDKSFIVAAQSGPRLVVVDLRWGAKTLRWVKGLQGSLGGPAAKAVGKMTGAIERYVREVAQPMAPAMAKLLHKGDLKKFSLQLQWTSRPGFLGGSKPFSYNLALTVGKPPKAGNQILSAQAQITEAQAGKIVDHLLKSGFYHRAVGMSPMTRQILRYPIGPAYTLTVWRGQGRGSVGNLGCGPRMLEHLDALRKVLDGEAAKAMDKLLASLAPDRKRWKAEGAMKPAQLAAHRAALLKKHSAMFRFWLACLVEPGQADRGSLTLSVPGLPKLLVVRRMYQAQISEAEAGKVIDYMAAEGYLTRAVCIPPRSGMVRSGPALIASAWHPDGYALTAASAWRAATLRKSFGALQKALPRISGAAKVFGALMTEQPAAGCSNPDHSPRTQQVETEPPVTRNVPPVQPRAASAPAKTSRVDYPSVFREAHRSVERWHVIRQHHLVSAIESLSTHGEGIAPFLIRLTKSERYGQRGWPFWALVCGTLAKVGGDEGATAMRNLKEDEKAYKHAREYAEKALAGEWPPDSANHRVERTR